MQARPGDPGRPGAPALGRLGGTVAGRYRLDERRPTDLPGAERWSATDQILARPVTVTLVSGDRTAAVLDAARRAALVVEPRLARILDVGSADGAGYVVTAAVEGRSLAALAARAPLAADQARAVVGEVASALEAARRRGVHHLALRPEVVVLTPGGRVVLEGLAVDGELVGASGGTAHAMSRADAVGLVRVLYAVLTGRWPGAAATPAAVPSFAEWSAGGGNPPPGQVELDAGLPLAPEHDGAPLPPVDLVPSVPADLDTLCAVTLGPHDDGPHSPGELVRELEPWRAVRADEIFQAADHGRWPALPAQSPTGGALAGAGSGTPTAPPTGSSPMSDDTQQPAADDTPGRTTGPRGGSGAGATAAGAGAGAGATAAGAATGATAAGGAAGAAGAGAGPAGAAAAGTTAASAAAGAAGGVARQSVRSAFSSAAPSAGARRPGTPPPAIPPSGQPAAIPPASRQPARTSSRATPVAPAAGTPATPAPATGTAPTGTAASGTAASGTATTGTAATGSPATDSPTASATGAPTTPAGSTAPADQPSPTGAAPASVPPARSASPAEPAPATDAAAATTTGGDAPATPAPAEQRGDRAPASADGSPTTAGASTSSTRPATGSTATPGSSTPSAAAAPTTSGAADSRADSPATAAPAASAAPATADASRATAPAAADPAALAVAGITGAGATQDGTDGEPADTSPATPERTPARRTTSVFGRLGGRGAPATGSAAAAAAATTPADGTTTTTGSAPWNPPVPEAADEPPVFLPVGDGGAGSAGADAPGDRPQWDLPFPVEEDAPSIAHRRIDPTRWVLGGVAVAVLVGVIIAIGNVLAPFRGGDAGAQPTAAPATSAPAAAPAETQPPAEQAPAAVPPAIATVTSIDPSDADGEHEELIGRLIDGDPATSWYTHTYNRPDFAGFKDAVGLVITLQQPTTVTAVTLDVNGSGGSVEVRSTDGANPTAGDVLASGALAPQTVLTLAQPTQTQSIVLWFTSLAQTPDGQNRIEITNLAVS